MLYIESVANVLYCIDINGYIVKLWAQTLSPKIL